jgi:hypothetical protein
VQTKDKGATPTLIQCTPSYSISPISPHVRHCPTFPALYQPKVTFLKLIGISMVNPWMSPIFYKNEKNSHCFPHSCLFSLNCHIFHARFLSDSQNGKFWSLKKIGSAAGISHAQFKVVPMSLLSVHQNAQRACID